MSTYALAIPESRMPRPSAYGTRAQVAGEAGDVEGYLALAGCDKRAGTASYALRIVNQSAQALRARMTCATLRGDTILAYPLDVHIAPFSVSETLLPVRVADIGPFDRAIVRVEGGAVAFSLEAPAPARASRRSRVLPTLAAAVLLPLICACAAAFSTPRLAVLAAPQRVFAGTAIDVPYAFGGAASLQYALTTADGRQLAAGLTSAHQGTMHFTIPALAGPQVTLAVKVAGPLGSVSQTDRITIVRTVAHKAPAALAAPKISAFAIVTHDVRAGAPIVVNYLTNAAQAEIWLIDDAGQLWARVAAPPSGETEVTVPRASAGRQLRVVLHARNAAGDAVASAVATVLPGAVAAGDAGSGGTDGTVLLSSDRVAPGQTFTVTITAPHTDADVMLTDRSGNQLSQGDISADQDSVVLTAPASTAPATYYVTASISQGVSQQSIVRKVTVAPGN